jgi:ketosteroid isomerase-like protein
MKRIACALLASGMSFAAQAAAPAEVVESFHKALASADEKAALALLADDFDGFETGFVDSSRLDYQRDSLPRDLDFASKTKREVQSQQVGGDDAVAWVETLTRTRGNYQGSAVDLSEAETAILKRDGSLWKIVHLHRSAHATRPSKPAAKK